MLCNRYWETYIHMLRYLNEQRFISPDIWISIDFLWPDNLMSRFNVYMCRCLYVQIFEWLPWFIFYNDLNDSTTRTLTIRTWTVSTQTIRTLTIWSLTLRTLTIWTLTLWTLTIRNLTLWSFVTINPLTKRTLTLWWCFW